jgi:hypothetical protein
MAFSLRGYLGCVSLLVYHKCQQALRAAFWPTADMPIDSIECRLMADAVEKVENRTTPKISQMVIFGLPRRCDAL